MIGKTFNWSKIIINIKFVFKWCIFEDIVYFENTANIGRQCESVKKKITTICMFSQQSKSVN